MRPNTIENDCHKVNCFSTATVRVSNFTAYPFSECIFVDTISEALGHVHGSKITGVYIKFSRDKIDAANRRVIDWMLHGIK